MYLYNTYVLGISSRISDRKIDYVRFRVDLGSTKLATCSFAEIDQD